MMKKHQEGLYHIPAIAKIPSHFFSGERIIPVTEVYSSQEEYLKFFTERIAILFDESGNFNFSKLISNTFLPGGDEGRRINYPEQYAILLCKNKKYKAAYELFSLYFKNCCDLNFMISQSLIKDKIHYNIFGNKENEFGVLGMYFFAKSAFKNDNFSLAEKIILKLFEQIKTNEYFDFDRSTIEILIASCVIMINYYHNHKLEDLENIWKIKKDWLKSTLVF